MCGIIRSGREAYGSQSFPPVKVAARAALESPQKRSPPLEAEEHAGDLQDAEVEVLNQKRRAGEARRGHLGDAAGVRQALGPQRGGGGAGRWMSRSSDGLEYGKVADTR